MSEVTYKLLDRELLLFELLLKLNCFCKVFLQAIWALSQIQKLPNLCWHIKALHAWFDIALALRVLKGGLETD